MNEHPHNSNLCNHCFRDATWILTHKHTREQRHYTFSEMVNLVNQAYISYYQHQQQTYSKETPQREDKVKAQVRCLHQASCIMFRSNPSSIVFVGFDEILPNYEIDCYGWHYQCPHCELPLDEKRKRGQQSMETLVCQHCYEILNR